MRASRLVKTNLKNLTCRLVLALAFLSIVITLHAAQETIISKKDADFVFGLTNLEWEKNAPKFFAPGWVVRSSKHETGTGVAAFNPEEWLRNLCSTLYRNDREKPEMVIVGNYFPMGALPPMTDDLKRSMELDAQKDLGAAYHVRINFTKMCQNSGRSINGCLIQRGSKVQHGGWIGLRTRTYAVIGLNIFRSAPATLGQKRFG